MSLLSQCDLSGSPQLQSMMLRFLKDEFTRREEFVDDAGVRDKLRTKWNERTSKYISEHTVALKKAASSMPDPAVALVTNLRQELMQLRSASNQNVLQRDSTARWRVDDPGDGHGAAIVCEGSDGSGCKERFIVHMVRPWLNQWQMDLLTIFEFDHVIEQRTLLDWVKDALARVVAEPAQCALSAQVVFKFLCTEDNLRVVWRHPCHDRKRHARDPPAEDPLLRDQ